MRRPLAGIGCLAFLTGIAAGTGCHYEPDDEDLIPMASNVVYRALPGVDPVLTSLDIYAPSTPTTGMPVFVWVHGGGWTINDKRIYGFKAVGFTAAGCLYVPVNYRLSPEVQHPAHVQDVAAAVTWVYHHIAEYGGDPNSIFLAGFSSSAHTVALLATDERYLQEAGLSLGVIKGAICLDVGAYDLPKQVELEPWSDSIVRMVFGDDPAAWAEASPIHHVAAGKGIPVFCVFYTDTLQGYKPITLEFADALQTAGVYVEVHHAADKNHITIDVDLGLPFDSVTPIVLDFMSRMRQGVGGS